jgi:hypothetical protein
MRRASAALAVILVFAFSIPAYAVGPGDEGIKVAQVQQLLQGFGYTVHVDGEYGPQTEKAVRSWQKSNGLQVDGEAGPATLSSLLKASRLNNAQQVTPIAPPPVPHYDQWVRLAQCESGSRWDYNGSSGYDGGLQFSPSTWRAMGGREFAEYAWQASAAEQMVVAERTLNESGWGAWPTCSRKLGFR